MFVEKDITLVLVVLLLTVLAIMGSFVIPILGYQRKRMKGVAIGCLLQPVVCGVVFLILLALSVIYGNIKGYYQRKSMMVTVRTTEPGVYGTDTLTRYLKPDNECLVEYKRLVMADSTETDSLDIYEGRDRFDIIRLDSLSTAVCVEDHIIVRFDLQNQKATATDYDQPIEVVDIDWDKVKAYFNK